MSVNPSDVIVIAPEYGAPFDPGGTLIPAFINFAVLQVDGGVWGNLADLARTYLAAHMLALSYPGGTPTGAAHSAGGPLTAETVGDVSRNFGQPSPKDLFVGDADLMSTGYGRQFLSLRSSLSLSPTVSGGPPFYPNLPQWPWM